MKQFCEKQKCKDGFEYEVWRRVGINGEYMYYAACRFSKAPLLGGCLFQDVEELKIVMNLPR